MSKYTAKYLKPTVFKPKGHWMVGFVWPVAGSKGNEYSVEFTTKGLIVIVQDLHLEDLASTQKQF